MIFRQDDSPRDTARLRRINPPLTAAHGQDKQNQNNHQGKALRLPDHVFHIPFVFLSSLFTTSDRQNPLMPNNWCKVEKALPLGRASLGRSSDAKSNTPRSAGDNRHPGRWKQRSSYQLPPSAAGFRCPPPECPPSQKAWTGSRARSSLI